MAIPSSLFVANARTALKLAFYQLGLQRGATVLLPDFVCDVLLHPFLQLGLVPAYYPVTQNLVPDWRVLESIAASRSCQALIMVHYFGQPQDIEKFQLFCKRHNLLLLEDNAHGYGGGLAGKPLGSFGDIGISSPRKIFGTPSGGVLSGANRLSFELAQQLKPFPIYRPSPLAKSFLHSLPKVRGTLKGWFNRDKNWDDPSPYREPLQPDYGIDRFSRWRIVSADLRVIARRRRENWLSWALFAQNNGLRTVFPDVHPESCPLALPVYASDLIERNAWLAWGAKKKVPLFPWPTLPEDIILLEGEALARWKRLICFPLDSSPAESVV